MKKFYSLILCAFMASAVVPAFADGSFVFWIDDREVATLQFDVCTLNEESNRPVTDFNGVIKDGYNVLTPSSFEYKLKMSFVGPTGPFTTWVYKNGVQQAPLSGQKSNYLIEVAENDVVKVFLAAGENAPTNCSVNFSGSGLDAAGIIADKVVNVDTSSAFSCFKGTEMIISGDNTEVFVNDIAVDADAEGKFVFVVDAATTNVAVNLKGSGIISAINDAADNVEIYNLQGIRVSNDVNALPAGVYIRGGKKILVR